MLLDDAALELLVVATEPNRLTCRVIVGGNLTSNKGVNLPGVALAIPALTEKDCEDALLALELRLDFLALSFVRRAADIEKLRNYLLEHVKADHRAPSRRRPASDSGHRLQNRETAGAGRP